MFFKLKNIITSFYQSLGLKLMIANQNSENLVFSVPNIKLLKLIQKIRLESSTSMNNDKFEENHQYISSLFAILLEITQRFDDLGLFIDLALDYAKIIAIKRPETTVSFLNLVINNYKNSDKPSKTRSIATRIAYSKLKMFLAQFRLEVLKDQNLADVRAIVYHSIPLIQELNFILVLIKSKLYYKATMFLQDISMLFTTNRVDKRLILPYYELVCIANLGAGEQYYGVALDALDQGYKITQSLPEATIQSARFITLFEKVMGFFELGTDKSDKNKKPVLKSMPNIEELKVPGVIFDYIFLFESNCPDPEGILVEM